jgi:predicted dehydrogenase
MKRRAFLKSAAMAAAAGFTIVPRHVLGGEGVTPPSEKLNIVGIGIGGQGAGDLKEMAVENIVGLVDVDYKKAANTIKTYPKATLFKDFRVMLDKMGKSVDAVMIATPDHMHAPISMAAMRAGKHVYVEKPMAHSVEEARVMTAYAKEHRLVTQMGNNGHGGEGLRQIKEWIDAGAIGTVKEVYGWTDRPGDRPGEPGHKWWPQPQEVPKTVEAVPAELDWDLWIGAAKERPYHKVYHPHDWRAFFDFGTGALGDMAIHNLDPAWYALDLGAPIATSAESGPLGADSYPAWQIITYEFAAMGNRPALKLKWYDGGKMPEAPEHLEGKYKLKDNGIMFVGDKGTMVCGGWSGAPGLFPVARRRDFELPKPTIPRSIGHRQEWMKACKEGKPADAKAGFWYSGAFTEALLVGNLATRLQKRIEWDAVNLRATNAPEAEPLVRKTYRKAFEL